MSRHCRGSGASDGRLRHGTAGGKGWRAGRGGLVWGRERTIGVGVVREGEMSGEGAVGGAGGCFCGGVALGCWPGCFCKAPLVLPALRLQPKNWFLLANWWRRVIPGGCSRSVPPTVVRSR